MCPAPLTPLLYQLPRKPAGGGGMWSLTSGLPEPLSCYEQVAMFVVTADELALEAAGRNIVGSLSAYLFRNRLVF